MVRFALATQQKCCCALARWPCNSKAQAARRRSQEHVYFYPDNRITEHPVQFVTTDGQWTAVTGRLEDTFAKPKVLADGKSIQPMNRSYLIPMASIGHWNKEGIMFEEFLYWDNGEFMKQFGIAG